MNQQKTLDQILKERLGTSNTECRSKLTIKYTKGNSIKENYNTFHRNSLDNVLKSKFDSIHCLEEGKNEESNYINIEGDIDSDSEDESKDETVLITENKEIQVSTPYPKIWCKILTLYMFIILLFGINNFILFKFTNVEWIGYD